MKLIDAVAKYKTESRDLLLTNGALDADRIALIYKLDCAVKTAESIIEHGHPFSVDITFGDLDVISDEIEEMDDRFRDGWADRLAAIELLFNYA